MTSSFSNAYEKVSPPFSNPRAKPVFSAIPVNSVPEPEEKTTASESGTLFFCEQATFF